MLATKHGGSIELLVDYLLNEHEKDKSRKQKIQEQINDIVNSGVLNSLGKAERRVFGEKYKTL